MEGGTECGMKWSEKDIGQLNAILSGFNKYKSKEIHRSVRGLKDVKFWKATEFRSFLLYFGIVALKSLLPSNIYQHSIRLSCAAKICYTNAYGRYLEIAKDWFNIYLEEYMSIYGDHTIGSNLHNLSHVYEDVKKFGSLMDTSTYSFENYLQFLKSRVKQPNLTLEQITRRLVELSLDYNQLNSKISSKALNLTQLRIPYKLIGNLAYKELKIGSDCTISGKKNADSWFLTTSDEIVMMNNCR